LKCVFTTVQVSEGLFWGYKTRSLRDKHNLQYMKTKYSGKYLSLEEMKKTDG